MFCAIEAFYQCRCLNTYYKYDGSLTFNARETFESTVDMPFASLFVFLSLMVVLHYKFYLTSFA